MNTSPPPPAAPPVPANEPPALGDCANCGTPLLGEHCYACGQPVKGLVRHFSSLVGDVLDSVFEWDARLPRTLWPLLAKPGYLTLEYFAGHRVRYVSPFRLFFFIAVLTFFVGKLVISFGSENPVRLGGDSGIETARSLAEVEQARDTALADLAVQRAELAPKIKAAESDDTPGSVGTIAGLRAADAALRASEIAIREQAGERIAAFREAEDTGGPPPVPRLHKLNLGGDEDWDPDSNPIRINGLPQLANDWVNRQAARAEKNIQRLQEDPDLFKDSLLGAIPSTLFVLLPLFALMLKLAYLFKRRLYMEHLIVALHSHAFLCLALLLVFVAMALERWLAPHGGALKIVFDLAEAAIWTWMPLYLLLMQKRVYGQGWVMTLLKYTVIGTCYFVLLTFGAVFMSIASLVWM